MKNQWLALDASTSPRKQARQVRRAWERALAGQREVAEPHAGIRDPIADSWRRSLGAGLDPGGWSAPQESDAAETRERWLEHPLSAIADAIAEELGPASADAKSLLVVSDANGLLLNVQGTGQLKARAGEDMGFVEGSRWAEEVAGTNAVGLALAADHGWICSAAPVHDPITGETVAVVDLTGPYETAHPLGLALAVNLAATMEHALADATREHDARLRQRYGDLTSATNDVLVSGDGRRLAGAGLPAVPTRIAIPDGGGAIVLEDGSFAVAEPLGDSDAYLVRKVNRVSGEDVTKDALAFAAFGRDRIDVRLGSREFQLSPRHSEIVVLLAEHPDGLTAEELAVALYGDRAKPVTARAEISRLRGIVGVRLEAEPYRLVGPVASDVGSLRRLLRQGRVAEAAALYAGPLLPHSEAPAVVDLRRELEGWTRHAVITSDDSDALWTWVTRPGGAGDLQAWVRFLSNVPYEDGRRALAAAHVARLRGA
jgi:hypothetical protein